MQRGFRVGDGQLGPERHLVEAREVQLDVDPQMLPRRKVSQQRAVRDQVASRRVCKDIVDPSSPWTRGVAVPVFVDGKGGAVLYGGAFGDVYPAFLQHLEEEVVVPNVDVGVHADEVRGRTHAGGRRGHLFEQIGAVPASVPIDRGDVAPRVRALGAAAGGPGTQRGKGAERFDPAPGAQEAGNRRVVGGGVDRGVLAENGHSSLLGSGGEGHVVGASVTGFLVGVSEVGRDAPHRVGPGAVGRRGRAVAVLMDLSSHVASLL